MRRIFSTAVIATAAALTAFTPAQAQLTAGIMAGVNSSSLSISDLPSVEGTSSQTGFMAGGWVGMHLGSMIALQVEGFYTQKGTKLTSSGSTIGTIKVDYVEVPVILRVGIPIIPVISPYIYGGPAIAFNVSCKSQPEGGTSTDCDDPTGIDTEIKSTDFSGIIGLGIQLSRFLIAIQYDHGFDNIIVQDTGTEEANNRTWTLKGGFGI